MMTDFVVPGWLLTFMPLVVLAITFLCARVPALAAYGKRNIGAVVAIVLAAIVIVLDPPELVAGNAMDYAAAVAAVVTYWWKGAQVIYDLITGQLATPERHAELSR
jgi:hypothetical protein